MREIKFRGKRVDNGEWVYGYYVRHETRQICPIGDDKLNSEEIKHLIVVDSFADWNMPRQLQGIEVISETVGQCTGLKDKNGVEIYEGDVLIQKDCTIWEEYEKEDGSKWSRATQNKKDEVYKVFYDEKTSKFTTNTSWLWVVCATSELIDNIHDNSELLEAK